MESRGVEVQMCDERHGLPEWLDESDLETITDLKEVQEAFHVISSQKCIAEVEPCDEEATALRVRPLPPQNQDGNNESAASSKSVHSRA